MRFLDNKKIEFEKWKKVNESDEYSSAIFDYAVVYADLIEEELNKNNEMKLKDIAYEASLKADKDFGSSGFMVCAAIKILSLTWIFGEELRIWFNSRYNYIGKGIVHNSLLEFDEETGKTEGFKNELLLEMGEKITPFMQEKYQ